MSVLTTKSPHCKDLIQGSQGELKVFPNPITQNSELTISGVMQAPSLELFNIYGQLIPVAFEYNNSTNTVVLEVEDWASGIYILKNNDKTWKIIVQ